MKLFRVLVLPSTKTLGCVGKTLSIIVGEARDFGNVLAAARFAGVRRMAQGDHRLRLPALGKCDGGGDRIATSRFWTAIAMLCTAIRYSAPCLAASG